MNHPAIYETITIGRGRHPIGHVVDVEPLLWHDGDNILGAVVCLDGELLFEASTFLGMKDACVFLGDRRVGQITSYSSTLMHGEREGKAEVNWNTQAMSEALKAYKPAVDHHDLQEIFDDLATDARNAPPAPPFNFPKEPPASYCSRRWGSVTEDNDQKEDPMKDEDQVKQDTDTTGPGIDTEAVPTEPTGPGPGELGITVEPGSPAGISYVSDSRMVHLPLDANTIKVVLVTSAISLAVVAVALIASFTLWPLH